MVSSTTRVWFITGASAGLGLALTRSVLARGDCVIATARSLKSFEELLEDTSIDQTRLRLLTLDVTSSTEEIRQRVQEGLSTWGRIDVLVNNAGTITYGASEELGAEGVMRDMQTNFVGPVNVTNAVLPHMRSRREGTVVFVGSRSAYRNQMIGMASYSASKAALHSYGETLAVELEPFSVRVIVTVPGGFKTKFSAPARAGTPLEGYEGVRDFMDKAVPMYVKIPKGDPALGMDALVDVVRGEGRAAGRGPPPLWLFLGEDSMRDVRLRSERLQATMDEWKDVGSNLGLPVEQLQL
ncbi:NAD-P-binding protein [Gloeopeniophorella convolvens]|nr:NAD-P-binding protein [Gloeopeniophorella convolvens]